MPNDGISYLDPRPRPYIVQGITRKTATGCGNLYLNVNVDDDGICEMFAHLGKAGGCPAAMLEGCMRIASLALRCGVDPQHIVKHLIGIRCPTPVFYEGRQNLSCMDAIGYTLSQILKGELPGTSTKGE